MKRSGENESVDKKSTNTLIEYQIIYFTQSIMQLPHSLQLHLNMDIEISPLRGGSDNSFMCGAKTSDPLLLVRGSFKRGARALSNGVFFIKIGLLILVLAPAQGEDHGFSLP